MSARIIRGDLGVSRDSKRLVGGFSYQLGEVYLMPKSKLKAKEKDIYGDIQVLHPNGFLMFSTNAQKIQWYLDRGLAEELDSKTYRLTFTPNGAGHQDQEYLLQNRENICAVCGGLNNLTRHHVFPKTYKTWLGAANRAVGFYDIMPVCVKDHEDYNIHQDAFMAQLAQEYGAPVCGVFLNSEEFKKFHVARGIALSLSQFRDKIPQDRKEFLEEKFSQLTGHNSYSTILQQEKVKLEHITHGQLVISKVSDINKFAQRWRQHFVDTMGPKFLPKGWTVDRRVYI